VDQASESERDYDLVEVLEDVVHNLNGQFKTSSIEIAVDCPSGLRLHGAVGALEQVLTNLLINSHLHAFAEGARPGRITIAARRVDDRVMIDYADDGAGMAAEISRQAFEPFFTTRRGAGGSGLGLYLVYNLITGPLGGTVSLESIPGKGSRFILDLPFRPALTI